MCCAVMTCSLHKCVLAYIRTYIHRYVHKYTVVQGEKMCVQYVWMACVQCDTVL